MADEKPQEDLSLLCPKCGCPQSHVRDTRNGRLKGRIVRYRVCDNCENTFRTVETVAQEG